MTSLDTDVLNLIFVNSKSVFVKLYYGNGLVS